MRTYTYTLLSTTGVAGTVSSSAHKIDYTVGYAMQAIYTGGLNGTLSLLRSNDGTNFSQIPGSTAPIAGAGNFVWDYSTNASYLYVQGKYVASSASSGTLQFLINSKGF